MEQIDRYGLLIADLVGLPLVAIAIVFAGPHRLGVVLAGASQLLHSPPMIYFNVVYWTPERLGG